MKNDVAAAKQLMTIDEYIEFEEQSDVRHEFINGNLIPMPGTSSDHNDICINIVHLLRTALKGTMPFKIHQENVKVQITNQKDYTYPDVVVVLDQRDFENQYIKKYPSVIFEVISKNSRVEDSVDKFSRYTNIKSLQNYILVDSEKVYVEVRTKQPNGEWEASTYLEADQKFPVPALQLELDLGAVYEGVSFLTGQD